MTPNHADLSHVIECSAVVTGFTAHHTRHYHLTNSSPKRSCHNLLRFGKQFSHCFLDVSIALVTSSGVVAQRAFSNSATKEAPTLLTNFAESKVLSKVNTSNRPPAHWPNIPSPLTRYTTLILNPPRTA